MASPLTPFVFGAQGETNLGAANVAQLPVGLAFAPVNPNLMVQANQANLQQDQLSEVKRANDQRALQEHMKQQNDLMKSFFGGKDSKFDTGAFLPYAKDAQVQGAMMDVLSDTQRLMSNTLFDAEGRPDFRVGVLAANRQAKEMSALIAQDPNWRQVQQENIALGKTNSAIEELRKKGFVLPKAAADAREAKINFVKSGENPGATFTAADIDVSNMMYNPEDADKALTTLLEDAADPTMVAEIIRLADLDPRYANSDVAFTQKVQRLPQIKAAKEAMKQRILADRNLDLALSDRGVEDLDAFVGQQLDAIYKATIQNMPTQLTEVSGVRAEAAARETAATKARKAAANEKSFLKYNRFNQPGKDPDKYGIADNDDFGSNPYYRKPMSAIRALVDIQEASKKDANGQYASRDAAKFYEAVDEDGQPKFGPSDVFRQTKIFLDPETGQHDTFLLLDDIDKAYLPQTNEAGEVQVYKNGEGQLTDEKGRVITDEDELEKIQKQNIANGYGALAGIPIPSDTPNLAYLKDNNNAIYLGQAEAKSINMEGNPLPVTLPEGTAGSGLLGDISIFEGTDSEQGRNKFASPYDVTLGFGKFDGGNQRPVTSMTLDELDKFQTGMINRTQGMFPDVDGKMKGSSATGRYQFTRTFMRDMRKRYPELTGDMVFTPELQDRLAMAKLQQIGLQEFLEGDLDLDTFQQRVAGYWASVPSPFTGKSISGQPNVKSERVRNSLLQAREAFRKSGDVNEAVGIVAAPSEERPQELDIEGLPDNLQIPGQPGPAAPQQAVPASPVSAIQEQTNAALSMLNPDLVSTPTSAPVPTVPTTPDPTPEVPTANLIDEEAAKVVGKDYFLSSFSQIDPGKLSSLSAEEIAGLKRAWTYTDNDDVFTSTASKRLLRKALLLGVNALTDKERTQELTKEQRTELRDVVAEFYRDQN